MNGGGFLFYRPTSHPLELTLLIAGAVLQVAGILTVVAELVSGRRAAEQLRAATPRPADGLPAPAEIETSFGQPQQVALALERLLRSSKLRMVGVAALVIGLGLSTASAVLSLDATHTVIIQAPH